MEPFSDRRMLVTGGASGSGDELAQRLAQAGAGVSGLDVDPARDTAE